MEIPRLPENTRSLFSRIMEYPPPSNISQENTGSMSWNFGRSMEYPQPSNTSSTPIRERRMTVADMNVIRFEEPPVSAETAALIKKLNLSNKVPGRELLPSFKLNPDECMSRHEDEPAARKRPRMCKFPPPCNKKKLPMEKPYTILEGPPNNPYLPRLCPLNLEQLDRIRKDLPEYYENNLMGAVDSALAYVNRKKGWNYKFVELLKVYEGFITNIDSVMYLTFTAKEDDADHVDTFQAAVEVSSDEGPVSIEYWDPAAIPSSIEDWDHDHPAIV